MVKKNTTALVVYKQQSQKPQKKKTVKKKNKGHAARPDGNASAYRAALSDPFSAGSQGARVPDMYSVPTTTRHITRSFTVSTNASGEADLVVLPSAFHHAISTRGSLVGGVNWVTADGASQAASLQTTPPASLSSQLVNYRIVGYGVKVFGVSSMTTTQGKVLMATVPVSSWVNDKNAAVGGIASTSNNSLASRGNTLSAYGVPVASSVVDISSLPNLSNSMETSMVRITENPVTVIPKVSSPEAFNFRQSADSSIGFAINNQTSASYVQSGDASYLRVGGHEAVVIAASGCVASTNVLQVEVIYHIEGMPMQSNTSVIGNDSSATCIAPLTWMNVIQHVAKMPSFREGVQAAGNSFFPGLGTLANRFM